MTNLAEEFSTLASKITVLPEKYGTPMKWSGLAIAELIRLGQKHLSVPPRDVVQPEQIAHDAAFIVFCANNKDEIEKMLFAARSPPSTTVAAYAVIGGELIGPGKTNFRDEDKLDLVGIYRYYEEAFSAWRAKAQSTVDNALMRYFVVPVGV